MITTEKTPSRLPRRAARVTVAFVSTLALLLGALGVQTAFAVDPPAAPTLTVNNLAIRATWPHVADAEAYTVRYSTVSDFSSSTTTVTVKPATASATTVSTIANYLKASTTYYFQVAVADVDGNRLSNYGTRVSAKTTAYALATPTGLAADNVTGTTIEVSWANVLNASAYLVRVNESGSSTYTWTPATGLYTTVKGLKKNTEYVLQVYCAQGADNGWPAIPQSGASSSITVKTSSYDLAAPENLRITDQKSASFTLTWDPPADMRATWKYQVQRALNTTMTQSATWSSPVSEPELTWTGLTKNTAYYVRVRVVDETGAQRSDRSGYLLAKTLIPRGTIEGKVTGAPGNDLVATAYDSSGEMAKQVPVDSKGEYAIKVRPGSYKVRITYVGQGDIALAWASSSNPAGGRIKSEGTTVTVPLEAGVAAPAVALSDGASFGGRILDTSDKPINAVDVALLSGWTSELELIDMTTTNSNGTYELTGIRDGKYWVRMKYSGLGFVVRSIEVVVEQGKVVSTRVSSVSTPTLGSVANPIPSVDATLLLADWYRTYTPWISGTKRVGYTVKYGASAWMAWPYPITRGRMTYQWKRNGAAISGATGYSYKLTSADKGKYLTLTVTGNMYGYKVQSLTSKRYYVS